MPCVLDGNVANWGYCLTQNTFGGDFLLLGLFLLVIFGFMLWRTKSPASVALPVGIILVYGFAQAGFDSVTFTFIWTLSIIAAGVLLALTVLNYAKK